MLWGIDTVRTLEMAGVLEASLAFLLGFLRGGMGFALVVFLTEIFWHCSPLSSLPCRTTEGMVGIEAAPA
jgi:hypothetical protein